MYDVTKNRSVPINKEMGLDNDNYLYVLHGNQVIISPLNLDSIKLAEYIKYLSKNMSGLKS